jgi:hypothetical protein
MKAVVQQAAGAPGDLRIQFEPGLKAVFGRLQVCFTKRDFEIAGFDQLRSLTAGLIDG